MGWYFDCMLAYSFQPCDNCSVFRKSARGTYKLSFVYTIASPADRRPHCPLPPWPPYWKWGAQVGSVRGGLGGSNGMSMGGGQNGEVYNVVNECGFRPCSMTFALKMQSNTHMSVLNFLCTGIGQFWPDLSPPEIEPTFFTESWVALFTIFDSCTPAPLFFSFCTPATLFFLVCKNFATNMFFFLFRRFP